MSKSPPITSRSHTGGGDRTHAADKWGAVTDNLNDTLRFMDEHARGIGSTPMLKKDPHQAKSVMVSEPAALARHYLTHLRTDFVKPLSKNEMVVLAVGIAIAAEKRPFCYSDIANLTQSLVGAAMVPTNAYDALEGLLGAGAIVNDHQVRPPGAPKSSAGYSVTELGSLLFCLTMATNRMRIAGNAAPKTASDHRWTSEMVPDLFGRTIGNA